MTETDQKTIQIKADPALPDSALMKGRKDSISDRLCREMIESSEVGMFALRQQRFEFVNAGLVYFGL